MNFSYRIKYWWKFGEHGFRYNRDTGQGIVPLRYNPLTDKVKARYSDRGYVRLGHERGTWVSRAQFDIDYHRATQSGVQHEI